RRGADDARRDVARQLVRNREAFGQTWQDMPVFGTSAARFNDDGVTSLYHHLRDRLAGNGLRISRGVLPRVQVTASTQLATSIPAGRVRYLAKIADTVRAYHRQSAQQVEMARRRQQLAAARDLVAARGGEVSTLDDLVTETDAALCAQCHA